MVNGCGFGVALERSGDDSNVSSAVWAFTLDTLDLQPPIRVPVRLLTEADSPRLLGENAEHVRALAESQATYPPIIVHRATMRVVDGMHRLRVAVLRGEQEIEVQFLGGDEEDAFVVAVQANVVHGLPLSLKDRTAAARRIVRSRAEWSDRTIASVTGLSPKTVAAIRRRSSEEIPLSNIRIGRDGRVRAINSRAGRMIARKLLMDQPDASLREIARRAGISPSTVHDVRKRLRDQNGRGAPAWSPDQKTNETTDEADATTRAETIGADAAATLRALRVDPSVRLTATGRTLLRLLDVHSLNRDDWQRLAETVPAHCNSMVAEVARECADIWQTFARELERRGHGTG